VQAFLAAVQAAKQKGADSVVLIYEEPDLPRPRDNSEVPVGGSNNADLSSSSSDGASSGGGGSAESSAESSSSSSSRSKTRRASTLASGPVLNNDDNGDGADGAAATAETVGASVFVGHGPGHWGTKEKAKEVIGRFLETLQLETYAPRFEVRAFRRQERVRSMQRDILVLFTLSSISISFSRFFVHFGWSYILFFRGYNFYSQFLIYYTPFFCSSFLSSSYSSQEFGVTTLEELCNPATVSPSDLRSHPLNLPRECADRLAGAAAEAKHAEQVFLRVYLASFFFFFFFLFQNPSRHPCVVYFSSPLFLVGPPRRRPSVLRAVLCPPRNLQLGPTRELV